MNNQGMIRAFITNKSYSEDTCGKVVFKENGTQVATLSLSAKQRRELDKFCTQADCKERWEGKPVDVVAEKVGEIVVFSLVTRKQVQ